MNGFVWLVGAGPGDPDLLTVKAARLLATADVVVHDALVGDGVLGLVPPSAELIDVGKRPGRPVPQELISTLLVELARGGQRVVRLKGGDPFVFGRGGEEAQTLLDAGVPFEIVPGITSAVAAPAAAGIPVTHRGVAAAVTVVTGHRRAGEPDVDWRSLAKVGGTVVVLMGVSQRGTIAAELIEGAGAYTSLGIAEKGGYHELMPLFARIHQSGFALGERKGTFWYQQADELIEIREGQLIRHDLKGHVSGGSRAILFDNEDNIWIATQYDGLVRLTRRSIGLVSDLTELEIAGIYSIVQDKEGTVWLGGPQLFKVKDGSVTQLTELYREGSFIRSITVDENDVLWVGGNRGLYRLENEKLIRVPQPALERRETRALFFDKAGTLWLGSNNGLTYLAPNGENVDYTTTDGLVDNDVHFITETRDGTLWIGTIRGISKFKDGRFENISPEDGLPAAYIRDIYEDEDGTIWIGTYGGGIVRLRGKDMVAIRRTEGLPNNFVSRILVDDAGKFWILSNNGIFAVDRSELNEVADRTKANLVGSIYGLADGMPSSEANGGHQLAGIKTRNGKLWFPMLRDVVIIDPSSSAHFPPA